MQVHKIISNPENFQLPYTKDTILENVYMRLTNASNLRHLTYKTPACTRQEQRRYKE